MKTTKTTLAIAAIALSMAVAAVSCRKKETTPTPIDGDVNSASDNSMAERTSDDVNNMIGIAVDDSGVAYYRYQSETEALLGCGTIARDTANKKVTITFNGSACQDGHTRSGSVTFDYLAGYPAKYYRNPGFKCTVTSSNYVVDGNAVSVNKTVTNTTSPTFNPATTNMTWTITSNISIVKSNGTISWNATKYKTLLNTSDPNVYQGQATPIIWNKAKVGITGNATGTTASGESFTANVTSQLVRDFTCSPDAAHPRHHPFIQGKFEFTPGTKYIRYFDYGSGTCDNTATVTINGNIYTITLK